MLAAQPAQADDTFAQAAKFATNGIKKINVNGINYDVITVKNYLFENI